MADHRFSFVSDKEVAEAKEKRVPLTTQRHTFYIHSVVNVPHEYIDEGRLELRACSYEPRYPGIPG